MNQANDALEKKIYKAGVTVGWNKFDRQVAKKLIAKEVREALGMLKVPIIDSFGNIYDENGILYSSPEAWLQKQIGEILKQFEGEALKPAKQPNLPYFCSLHTDSNPECDVCSAFDRENKRVETLSDIIDGVLKQSEGEA